MNSLQGMCGALLVAALSGCATSQDATQQLQNAQASFEGIRDNTEVLRSAPKDVIRSGETLVRAERFSSYLGSSEDVMHYAYLSQRYSDIAKQKSLLTANNERAATLELERQRLQLTLREAKLLTLQEQNGLLGEQLVNLVTTDTERGLVITIGDVLFDAGHADLKASANRTVLKLVQFLQLHPLRVVRIEGYTDSSGDTQQNIELSQARAQTVADALIDLGIDSKRISVQGLGESFPVAENASAKGRAQNRRVEVVFSDEQGRMGAAR
jgi:outer membrane protein OmpA-like peptidoglycan-associated protein